MAGPFVRGGLRGCSLTPLVGELPERIADGPMKLQIVRMDFQEG